MTTENKERVTPKEEGTTKLISLESLKKAVEDLPTPLRDRVIKKAEEYSMQEKKTPEEERNNNFWMDSATVGLFLREVTQRVYGFSINDLSILETREIDRIKRDLERPGILIQPPETD